MSGWFDDESSGEAKVESAQQPVARRPEVGGITDHEFRPPEPPRAIRRPPQAPPPADDWGFNQGGRDATEDPFSEPAGKEPADFDATSSGEEPEAVDEEGDGMAGIEANGDREPHQVRRDKIYDTLDGIADSISAAAGVAGVRNPAVGVGLGAVGGGMRLVNTVGRGVGKLVDDVYDRDDANKADQAKKDLDRLKDKAAVDKINKNTPKGAPKIVK
ncbi:hypothetical protein D7V97_01335 [Corallococcus sp. CA053C]|uniref:hypothetical protein n=1 Tax=Corallococcus sp. CA053C TaxID=2316732 RepID=UPI000EA30FD5|nr:hypothetical protein [Corallococcus sp. CA053C]RKH15090.1 hypothetical protein D7V97_01335 [Corallococcus sp. CA053C]